MSRTAIDDQQESIETLIDVTEAMLNVLEKKGIDPEYLSRTNEFTVLVHYLKAVIDGELGIDNPLIKTIKEKSAKLPIDNSYTKKLH